MFGLPLGLALLVERPLRDETAPGVPLSHYRQHGAGVRLTCRDCKAHRDLPLEAVIGRLEARGVGGERTGIVALAQLVRGPCPRCGGSRFVTAPAWAPSRPSLPAPARDGQARAPGGNRPAEARDRLA